MEALRDYTLWFTALSGALYAVIKLLQSAIKYLSTKTGGDVATFESVTGQLNKMLLDCRETCERLKVVHEAREEHWRQQVTNREASILADRQHFLEQIARLNRQLYECEGILQRKGWSDTREKPRE